MKLTCQLLASQFFLQKVKKANIIEEMEGLPQKPKYEVFQLVVPFLTENAGEEEERERNLVVIER